jgi:hypothetical protein
MEQCVLNHLSQAVIAQETRAVAAIKRIMNPTTPLA